MGEGGEVVRAIGRLEDLLSVIGWRSMWGWRGGGGSAPRDTCRPSLKLAPKRRPKFPVPLYIPYFFMDYVNTAAP